MNSNNKVKLNSFSPLLGPITLESIGKSLIVCGASNIIRTTCWIAMVTIREFTLSHTCAHTHTHSRCELRELCLTSINYT